MTKKLQTPQASAQVGRLRCCYCQTSERSSLAVSAINRSIRDVSCILVQTKTPLEMDRGVAGLMVTRHQPTLGALRLKSQMCNTSSHAYHHVPSLGTSSTTKILDPPTIPHIWSSDLFSSCALNSPVCRIVQTFRHATSDSWDGCSCVFSCL